MASKSWTHFFRIYPQIFWGDEPIFKAEEDRLAAEDSWNKETYYTTQLYTIRLGMLTATGAPWQWVTVTDDAQE